MTIVTNNLIAINSNIIHTLNIENILIILKSRPEAGKMKKSFDWTFSTDYQGTLSDNITVQPTEEQINFALLKRKDQILFYHDLTLFEDELHDHGISKMSVKIVSITFTHNYKFRKG